MAFWEAPKDESEPSSESDHSSESDVEMLEISSRHSSKCSSSTRSTSKRKSKKKATVSFSLSPSFFSGMEFTTERTVAGVFTPITDIGTYTDTVKRSWKYWTSQMENSNMWAMASYMYPTNSGKVLSSLFFGTPAIDEINGLQHTDDGVPPHWTERFMFESTADTMGVIHKNVVSETGMFPNSRTVAVVDIFGRFVLGFNDSKYLRNAVLETVYRIRYAQSRKMGTPIGDALWLQTRAWFHDNFKLRRMRVHFLKEAFDGAESVECCEVFNALRSEASVWRIVTRTTFECAANYCGVAEGSVEKFSLMVAAMFKCPPWPLTAATGNLAPKAQAVYNLFNGFCMNPRAEVFDFSKVDSDIAAVWKVYEEFRDSMESTKWTTFVQSIQNLLVEVCEEPIVLGVPIPMRCRMRCYEGFFSLETLMLQMLSFAVVPIESKYKTQWCFPLSDCVWHFCAAETRLARTRDVRMGFHRNSGTPFAQWFCANAADRFDDEKEDGGCDSLLYVESKTDGETVTVLDRMAKSHGGDCGELPSASQLRDAFGIFKDLNRKFSNGSGEPLTMHTCMNCLDLFIENRGLKGKAKAAHSRSEKFIVGALEYCLLLLGVLPFDESPTAWNASVQWGFTVTDGITVDGAVICTVADRPELKAICIPEYDGSDHIDAQNEDAKKKKSITDILKAEGFHVLWLLVNGCVLNEGTMATGYRSEALSQLAFCEKVGMCLIQRISRFLRTVDRVKDDTLLRHAFIWNPNPKIAKQWLRAFQKEDFFPSVCNLKVNDVVILKRCFGSTLGSTRSKGKWWKTDSVSKLEFRTQSSDVSCPMTGCSATAKTQPIILGTHIAKKHILTPAVTRAKVCD